MNSNFSPERIPFLVFTLAIAKAMHSAYFSFFAKIDIVWKEVIPASAYIVDNLMLLPLILFFVYFFLYRSGRISNDALRNATIMLLVAILPKLIGIGYLLSVSKFDDLTIVIGRVIDIVVWILFSCFLLNYWRNDFKLKEHRHHHHHHHHSSKS